MRYLMFVLLALLWGCEGDYGREMKPTMDRTGLSILTTTYYYDSVEEVMEAYRDFYDIPKHQPVERLHGFAVWPEWVDKNGNKIELEDQLWCEVHSLRPRRIDDNATLTHGHESVHCIYGSYHPK